MNEQSFEEGKVLLINKRRGWTSFDVVRKIRNTVRLKKVGHAGTLDPLATGLLVICTGKYTRKISEFMGQEKEYTGTFIVGATTPTYDLESAPRDFREFHHLTPENILATARSFTGDILQVPPVHSAIKQQGQPVYLKARKGEEVRLEPRKVTIREFEITGIALPEISFRIVCSTGTYIRSIAHDFGNALEVGAYLGSLCRTRIGAFSLDQAQDIDEFVAART